MTLWEIHKGDVVQHNGNDLTLLEEPHPLLLGEGQDSGPGIEAQAKINRTGRVVTLRDYKLRADKLHFVRITRLEDRDVEDIQEIIKRTIKESLAPIFQRLAAVG